MIIRAGSCILAIFWVGFEFYLSHQSTLSPPHIFSGQDKLLHAAYGGVLALLLLGCFKFSPPDYTARQKAIAIVSASLYGAIDEIHQYFIPGRYSDFLDWLADTTGAIVAISFAGWLIRKYQSRK
ncbi:MAG: VanZ family protein [Gammaproteobacteria bacterium]